MFSSTDIDRISSTSDTEEGAAAELAKYVVGWNLLGPNGEPWPPGRDSMLALMPPTLAAIVSAIGDGIRESSGLPNASSARSPASPRAGASRTRKTTPKPGT